MDGRMRELDECIESVRTDFMRKVIWFVSEDEQKRILAEAREGFEACYKQIYGAEDMKDVKRMAKQEMDFL